MPLEGSNKSMVLFGGMIGGGENMLRTAAYFRGNAGFNTLVVTRRGFTGSDGSSIEAGELGIYYDVQASISYLVREQSAQLRDIWWYGNCLGGAYAAMAGTFFTDLGGIVLDRAFPNLLENAYRPFRFVPKIAFKRVYKAVFPKGIKDSIEPNEYYVEPRVPFVSTGMSLLKMFEKYQGPEIFFVYGADDWVIPHYQTLQLVRAYNSRWYTNKHTETWPLNRLNNLQNVAVVKKGHYGFFLKDENVAEAKLLRFIRVVNCIQDSSFDCVRT
jgi:hypothetical protein